MTVPIKDQIAELFAVHTGEVATSERLLRSYGLDDTRSWIDPHGHRLSDRVWNARRDVRDQIDQVLRRAIADGEDALLTARKLEQFLDPDLAPVRTVAGRLVRNQRPVIVSRAPGRGGMGSFSARRLARTEITRAHGAAVIWSAERTPGNIGVKWSVSGNHPKADECNIHAARDTGLGKGVYAPRDVPRYPEHPQCRCTLAQATTDDVDGLIEDLRAKYSIGNVGDDTPTEPRSAPRSETKPVVPATKDGIAVLLADRYGITITKADGSLALWKQVASVIVDEVGRGGRFPPELQFRYVGKGVPAAYVRQVDRATGKPINEHMAINHRESYWKDPTREGRVQFDAGFWSTADPQHPIVHEAGHYQHFQNVTTDSRGLSFTATDGRVIGGHFPAGTNHQDIARRVSRYAASQPSEFVAETYAGVRLGKTFDDEVMDLYRYYGGTGI